MRLLLLAIAMLTGCSTLSTAFTTPPSNGFEPKPYDAEVEYELLAPSTGKACADHDTLRAMRYKSKDPRAIGNGVLFERAKYEAIELASADGLLELRARVEQKGDGECVTVAGRAYRLQSYRATHGYEGGDRSSWDPFGESSKNRRRQAPDAESETQ